MQKNNLKRVIAVFMLLPVMMAVSACGKSDAGYMQDGADDTIEGDLADIMLKIYDGLEGVDTETKEAMQGYVSDVLTEENEQSLLGTADIDYIEGIYSVPMMSSIAYQCVLLRVAPDDIENVKQQLKDNADLNKWVCVSAETLLVENVGDLVLFVMSDKDVAYALSASFQAL